MTIAFLGVECDTDGCDNVFTGDFVIAPGKRGRAYRLGIILDWVADKEGWEVVGRDNPVDAATFCPKCKKQRRLDLR